MAVRTTETEVGRVIEIDSDLWHDDLIAHASIMVDNLAATKGASELSDNTLAVIETYIAAHLYCLVDPRPQQEKAGKGNVKYQGTTGEGLLGTWWGQMALSFDYTGSLSGMTSTDIAKSLTISWMGQAE